MRDYSSGRWEWVWICGTRLGAMICKSLDVAIVWEEAVEKTARPASQDRPMLIYPL